MSSEDVPRKKKKKTNPSPPSFLSLPDVIIVNCLALIPSSYYPKLTLVCKTFRSLILHSKLSKPRYHLNTRENFFQVCLQLPNNQHPSWFTLWIKPNQTLTNDLHKKKKSTGNTRLVELPSSYYPRVPHWSTVKVGSERYAFKQGHPPSRDMLVSNKRVHIWRKAPKMTVARENAIAGVLNGKIYVMGGCKADESTNWAEVFDTKTQTWEPLPDPGPEFRFCSIKRIEGSEGKLYVRSNEKKDYCYDPEEGKWDDVEKPHMMCKIKKVWYHCDSQSFLWLDEKRKRSGVVRGLAALNRFCRSTLVEMVNYRGKLLILWDKFAQPRRHSEEKNIWCAVIALERRINNDEVWGKVEWANIVLTVPSPYVFLRSRQKKV